MPTINDATVVASALDTSGNGGRKLIRFNDGTFAVFLRNVTTDFRMFKSSDGGNSFSQSSVFLYAPTSTSDISSVSDGTYSHVIMATSSSVAYVRVNSTGTQLQSSWIENGTLTAVGNTSITYNPSDNTLHAAWASKNATYPNSFNIRYAKGTINGDGSVTWGAVEQVTTDNTTGYDFTNPTIIVKSDGYPVILVQNKANTTNYIDRIIRGTSSWGGNGTVYNGTTYTQSNPSAIFVPQSINGLANGRIWVAWHGTDATDNVYNIRYSYSDDGGVTWSTMQKLTSGNTYNQQRASITANKYNEIFVVWDGNTTSTFLQIKKIKWSNNSWGSITQVTSNTSANALLASALLDVMFNLNFSEPLFIYQNVQTAKVGFYGAWAVTTISVTQGDIGTKSDKSNLLTYTITTDGTMGTITESVNGTTVATKNIASGVQTICGLTQAQWDAIHYGKYKDATGGKNTLTVTMGSDTFTYTFDKRQATTDDIAHAIQATQDTQNIFLPSVKKNLASAIRAKGGTVNDTDSWDTIQNALNSLGYVGSGRKASGTATSGTGGYNNTVVSTGATGTFALYPLTITGLTFQPTKIIAYCMENTTYEDSTTYVKDTNLQYVSERFFIGEYNATSNTNMNGIEIKPDANFKVNSNGFTLPVWKANGSYTWYAFE